MRLKGNKVLPNWFANLIQKATLVVEYPEYTLKPPLVIPPPESVDVILDQLA